MNDLADLVGDVQVKVSIDFLSLALLFLALLLAAAGALYFYTLIQ